MESLYFIGFTPSCNKDSDSIRIVNSSPDEETAKEVLADLTSTPLADLHKFKLQECKACLTDSGSDLHDGPCINSDRDEVSYSHTIYCFPLNQKQYEEAGLDLICIEKCQINLPRFWIIEVPKGTKRSIVTNMLHSSIV